MLCIVQVVFTHKHTSSSSHDVLSVTLGIPRSFLKDFIGYVCNSHPRVLCGGGTSTYGASLVGDKTVLYWQYCGSDRSYPCSTISLPNTNDCRWSNAVPKSVPCYKKQLFPVGDVYNAYRGAKH
eukprot:3261707-Rhodomonas_salina.1